VFIVSIVDNTQIHFVGKIQSFLNAKTDYTYSYHYFKTLISPLINTSCGLVALGRVGFGVQTVNTAKPWDDRPC
jgi:hypothetical protein